jgi:hypothetical protein
MGAEIFTMGMGMRAMSFREALLFLGVVWRVRGDVIGRMMGPVSLVALPVLAIELTGMWGSFWVPCIPLLSWWHMLYSACSFIKQTERVFRKKPRTGQGSGSW